MSKQNTKKPRKTARNLQYELNQLKMRAGSAVRAADDFIESLRNVRNDEEPGGTMVPIDEILSLTERLDRLREEIKE